MANKARNSKVPISPITPQTYIDVDPVPEKYAWQGPITKEEYNQELRKAREVYDALTDSLARERGGVQSRTDSLTHENWKARPHTREERGQGDSGAQDRRPWWEDPKEMKVFQEWILRIEKSQGRKLTEEELEELFNQRPAFDGMQVAPQEPKAPNGGKAKPPPEEFFLPPKKRDPLTEPRRV